MSIPIQNRPTGDRPSVDRISNCMCTTSIDVRARCQPCDDNFDICPAQADTLLFIIDCCIDDDRTSVSCAINMEHAFSIITNHVMNHPEWRCSEATLIRMLDIYEEENEHDFEPYDDDDDDE